jgi:hypothetical protein
MSDDNDLFDFLHERVLATRQMHRVTYPPDLEVPATAVLLECPEAGLYCVLMPTFVGKVLHIETHFFADGLRVNPTVTVPDAPDGCVELQLHRPT